MAFSKFTEETRAKLNDLIKYWKKWEHVKDADVLQLLDQIANGYGGKVVNVSFIYLTIIVPPIPKDACGEQT